MRPLHAPRSGGALLRRSGTPVAFGTRQSLIRLQGLEPSGAVYLLAGLVEAAVGGRLKARLQV